MKCIALLQQLNCSKVDKKSLRADKNHKDTAPWLQSSEVLPSLASVSLMVTMELLIKLQHMISIQHIYFSHSVLLVWDMKAS